MTTRMVNWQTDPSVTIIERGRTETGPDHRNPVGLAEFPAGTYPACKAHGALLCMTPQQPDRPQVWRCDSCHTGTTWTRPKD